MAEEARSFRVFFAFHGCAPREAAFKVVELFSPPRVTRALQSWSRGRRFPNLAAGSTFDFQA
eukprot:9324247-Alexandrium_andersonii.AAC.1